MIILPWGKHCCLPPPWNGTSLFTGHILRENVRTIHQHDLHHYSSRWHTCTTSSSFDDHLRQLGNVFAWLHHNNLQVNDQKLSFCALETKYLCFILTREGIKLLQQKVNAILQVPPPCNDKQVRSFVSMLNHYKAMIPCCSHLLTLLTALTKKNIKFEWTTKHQQAFNSLKNSLTCEVIFTYLDFSIPFEIYTDTSKYKIGSIISYTYIVFLYI
jgi:hypothetical protein